MVMVTWLTLCAHSALTRSGKTSSLMERHNLKSGACPKSLRKVAKVRSGLASGSPGPAMPTTASWEIAVATARTFFTARAGLSTSDTTPGREFVGTVVLAIVVATLNVARRRHSQVHPSIAMVCRFRSRGVCSDPCGQLSVSVATTACGTCRCSLPTPPACPAPGLSVPSAGL